MAAGRKRKSGVLRDKRGKSRGEPLAVHPETIAVRQRDLQRDGVRPDEALNALAGFTLGRLYLRHQANPFDAGSINRDQYINGSIWQEIVRRHASVMGYKLHIHTPSFVMVSTGTDCRDDPNEDWILRIRRQFSDCYNSLMFVCRDHGLRVRDVTYGVCIENWPVAWLTGKDFGRLKIGLNAIGKALK